MFRSIIFFIVHFLFSLQTTKSISAFKSIVIQVKGDCETIGAKVAQEHGYRYARTVILSYNSSK